MSIQYRSTALWPAGTVTGRLGHLEITSDLLATKDLAMGVNYDLHRHGYGGAGKVKPIKTAVDPMDGLTELAEEIYSHMQRHMLNLNLNSKYNPSVDMDTGVNNYAFLSQNEKDVYRAMAEWHKNKVQKL